MRKTNGSDQTHNGPPQTARPTWNQADKVIARFGGEANLAACLGMDRSTFYRWRYPQPKGRDGMVPSCAMGRIARAARLNGVVLTPKDWFPERISYEPEAPEPEEEL